MFEVDDQCGPGIHRYKHLDPANPVSIQGKCQKTEAG
jgi:hypothetical protein